MMLSNGCQISRRFYFIAILLSFVAAILSFAGPAAAQLRIDITRGKVEPMPIAITEFQAQTPDDSRFGKDISGVVSADLERSGLFRPVDPKAFIDPKPPLGAPPRFADWRVINAQAMVHGQVRTLPDGQLQVDFRLWDVLAGQQMEGASMTGTPAQGIWRKLAHRISDAIYKRITGEDGYFDTRIVYIAETGPLTRRIKRLATMDQDGANHQFLTDGSSLALTPRFSPSQQEITFLSYHNNTPRVYIYNMQTGRQEVLGDFPGMTFAPRFSPDGNGVIMSMAKDGNSEIYSMDLRTRRVTQLTTNSFIDTAPSFSPDGRRIAFESDRGGTQQIYIMDANGGNVERISFGQGRYATPVWSPRGDLIAFTKQFQGTFYIGVMRPDGKGERQLAQGFLVEGPTWAPNGRVLMFYKQIPWDRTGSGGGKRIFSIDLTGFNERELVTPVDGSDPAWSPLNPS